MGTMAKLLTRQRLLYNGIYIHALSLYGRTHLPLQDTINGRKYEHCSVKNNTKDGVAMLSTRGSML